MYIYIYILLDLRYLMAFMVCSKPYAFWNPFIRHVQVLPPYQVQCGRTTADWLLFWLYLESAEELEI